MQQQPVADEALVHEDVDRIAIQLLQFRLRIKAAEPQRPRLSRRFIGIFFPRRRFRQSHMRKRRFRGQRQQLPKRLFAEDLINAFGRARDGRRGNNRVARRNQLEVLLRMRQRVMSHQRRHVRQLSRFRAQKFPPRRRVEEKIGDRNGGSPRQRRVFHAQHFAAGNVDVRARRFFAVRGVECNPRHRSNRRQRLAAEPQSSN